MEQEKNITLTVVQPQQVEEDEIRIDFPIIFLYFKRFFSLWLALAIGLGAISGGVGILLQETVFAPKAETLIGFYYPGGTNGLTPDGKTLDLTQITSPKVLLSVLAKLDLKPEEMGVISENIKIDAITPESSYLRMTFYKEMIDKEADLDLVERLLAEGNVIPHRYIVSFDYKKAGYSYREGAEILNEVIKAYREWFELTYNRNTALGNAIAIIDYRDYDFAEAISIFSDTLSSIDNYMDSLNASSPSFRSNRTGYSFSDLSKNASVIREIELDRAASYVILHHVTINDIDTMIGYYEWRIENIERNKVVLEKKLATLQAEIAAYEKDPVLYVAGEGNNSITGASDSNGNYDSMIEDELSTQASISSANRTIAFYQDVIEGFRDAKTVQQSDIEQVQKYLESLNSKVNVLINNVNKTADDYYDELSRSRSVTTVVPAVVNRSLITKNALIVFAVVEVLLLVWYFAISISKGLAEANSEEKKKQRAQQREQTVVVNKPE